LIERRKDLHRVPVGLLRWARCKVIGIELNIAKDCYRSEYTTRIPAPQRHLTVFQLTTYKWLQLNIFYTLRTLLFHHFLHVANWE
jgi:hypothetical protein